ncbi:D-isomer specific 2-hydroxyacid dehydrogenase [Polychaeton citri CBS 116435]|uniref:D-isomer specific 2-hydroxyacid dehydrogenase n=1 Tax=Polychaeton citri CBS 116435 TaxID=1314669 RepID=A0A9P4PWB8_9PEZI|nr:D-isomer specific 2-hydroxyacid dehydrogenase [Polychaeton citri CBS 116435]
MPSSNKPILLHCGDDIKWNHPLYQTLQQQFTIVRSYSISRADFISALKSNKFGNFSAIYRPFWNTGGEMSPWDQELISLLPSNCQIYASAGAGFDWVDTKALAKRGIIYCNAAAACTESVADAAIWLTLSTFRAFTWSAQAARSADPEKFNEAHRGAAAITKNPNGHKLGIIGLGKIGFRIAEKAYGAFGMDIVYNDIRRLPIEMERKVDAEFYDDIDDMLTIADCVIVATPFGGEKVMNAEKIRKMKKGSRLVNIARGKLVDEDALVKALESGHLESAGLDVHFDEPNVNKKLASMRNVEVLSHTAGASVDSHAGFERLGMENILSFFQSGKAITPVNLHLLDQAKL